MNYYGYLGTPRLPSKPTPISYKSYTDGVSAWVAPYGGELRHFVRIARAGHVFITIFDAPNGLDRYPCAVVEVEMYATVKTGLRKGHETYIGKAENEQRAILASAARTVGLTKLLRLGGAITGAQGGMS